MMEGNEEEEEEDDSYPMFPEYGDAADNEDNEAEDQEAPDEPVDDDLGRAIADARIECETEKESVLWDEYKQEEFDLRALLFVTINDWPALGNISGQSNKGYNACTHCLDELEGDYLDKCKKVVYLGIVDFCVLPIPIKVPSGFSSNIKRIINMAEKKFQNLKSHDCHVIMTQLLPIALRGLLPENVRLPIVKLCAFLNAISQKVINPEILPRLQNDVVQCLVSFELVFPPSFFNIMTHLLVHLVDEISILGLYFYTICSLERFMGVLKKYVHNRARSGRMQYQDYYPTAQVVNKYRYGHDLVKPGELARMGTQMRRLHEWYMRACRKGDRYLTVSIRDEHYFRGKEEINLELEELFQLFNQDALDKAVISCYCLMKKLECKRGKLDPIGFIDPNTVHVVTVRDYPKDTEENMLMFLQKQADKEDIFFPYNFNFHFILLIIQLKKGVVLVMDSKRYEHAEWENMAKLLQRAWKRFINVVPGEWKPELTFEDYPPAHDSVLPLEQNGAQFCHRFWRSCFVEAKRPGFKRFPTHRSAAPTTIRAPAGTTCAATTCDATTCVAAQPSRVDTFSTASRSTCSAPTPLRRSRSFRHCALHLLDGMASGGDDLGEAGVGPETRRVHNWVPEGMELRFAFLVNIRRERFIVDANDQKKFQGGFDYRFPMDCNWSFRQFGEVICGSYPWGMHDEVEFKYYDGGIDWVKVSNDEELATMFAKHKEKEQFHVRLQNDVVVSAVGTSRTDSCRRNGSSSQNSSVRGASVSARRRGGSSNMGTGSRVPREVEPEYIDDEERLYSDVVQNLRRPCRAENRDECDNEAFVIDDEEVEDEDLPAIE
ncbi:hypothetical protein QYE76_035578 [Lolium multiflorum]|uniref:DUF4218 domain-containing protein n=1 Tax=Lolium multiflorum TaxID=4521 RepID=A0AAD8R0Q0_LOLMU|nr:hypothetical protein QYE76_035578 [Lolium multiflorum]